MKSNKQVALQHKGGVTRAVITEQHENKMLSKEELEAYNEIYPNFGKEYLQEVLENNKTIRKDIKHNGRNETIGLIAGVFLVFLYIGVIVFLCYISKIDFVCLLIGTSLVALVIAITIRKVKKNQ